MSQGFKTEADVMRNTAHRVDDTNQEVSAELSRLRSIVDGVRASWEGTAQVSFDNLMQLGCLRQGASRCPAVHLGQHSWQRHLV